jgi:dCMP deaminase
MAQTSDPVPAPHPDDRPSWDEYFMAIAETVATRSTCLRRHVGAILVRDRNILSTGYNGAPSGLEHCGVVGCLREQRHIPSGQQSELCRGVHAEQNAVVQAARHGIRLDGATLYATTQPCVTCAKILINAGVVEIVYRDPYPDELSAQLLDEAGIRMRRIPSSIASVASRGVH